jgi:hypothetical protein
MVGTTTLAVLSQALKTNYLEELIEFINDNAGPFYQMITKGNHAMPNNDEFTWFMKYGSSAGIKNMAEDGTFGTAGGRKYKQAKLSVINMGAPFAITDKAISATKNTKRSIVDALTNQMEDLSKDFRFQMRRQMFGSKTGVIATTGVTSAANLIVLASDTNMNKFRRGMVIDILDESDSDTVIADSREITGIDRAAKKITIDGAVVTTEAADKVVIEGSAGIEMTGLEDIMTADSTIYDIDRSDDTYSFMNPFVTSLGDSVTDLSLADFDSMIDDIDELFGQKVDYIHGQKGPVGNYVETLRRYNVNVNTQDFVAGRRVIKYGDVVITKEPLAKPNTMDFLSTEHFKLAYLGSKPFDWMNREGGTLLKQLDRKPIYEAFLIGYMNLLNFMPSAQGRITNIKNY